MTAVAEMQDRVAQRLTLLGPGPTAFYRDACRIVREVSAGRWPLATATHLVGHLLRDLDSGVKQVLYAQLVEQSPVVTAEPPAGAAAFSGDPLHAARAGAIDPPESGTDGRGERNRGPSHREQVLGILQVLGFADDSPEARQWLALGKGDIALHRLAHRDALNPPRPLDEQFVATFEETSRLLDSVLDRFAARYGSVYDQLDALLALKAPIAADVQRLQQEVPNTPHTLGYFFERLQHPGWLDPLAARGFFSAPPGPVVDLDRNTISYVNWAGADYLRRMASVQPAKVAAILAAMRPTDNLRVQAQLIEVMLALRSEDRAALAPRVESWVAGFSRNQWGDEIPRFALALLQDERPDLALAITERLLGLPNGWRSTLERPEATYRWERERPWHLREAVKALFPALCRAEPIRTVELLSAALDFHVGRRAQDAGAPADARAGLFDYSDFWAEDLGADEGIDATDVRLLLTVGLRQALRQVASEEPAALSETIAHVRRHGARVLRRIELATLAEVLTGDDRDARATALPLALERLSDPAIFDEPGLNAEVAALLRAAFPMADAMQQRQVLDALVPPDFSWLPEEHLAAHRDRWRRDRLALIADHLPARERGELRALIASQGTPEPLKEPPAQIFSSSGYPSPLSEAQFAEMDLDELIGFLSTWQPRARRSSFDEPTREGIAGMLSGAVTNDPVSHVGSAPRFIGQHPAYVAALLDGFRMAARGGKPFSWTEVLQLTEWAVAQPVSPDDVSDDSSDASRWRRARRAAADLVGLALGEAGAPVSAAPLTERERLKRIIEVLVEDANPSPAYEARAREGNTDPMNLAINTVRPEAISAAIRFAYWSAEHRTGAGTGDGVAMSDVLAREPDIAAILEHHLDPEHDPSVAVRAAIGQWLTSLTLTDARWVADHKRLLFPPDSEHHELRDALWEAFLRWARPHPRALVALEPEYRAAIDRLAARVTEPEERSRSEERPEDRVAEHLATLYWWGAIPLDTPDSLIAYFFAHADVRRRARALEYIGRSLLNTAKPADPVVVQRLQRLWEWRAASLLERARVGSAAPPPSTGGPAPAEARQELSQFGWWFACDAFEPAWALARLEEALRACGDVKMGHQVAERLAELAVNAPGPAVLCLSQVDFARIGRWDLHGWLEQLPNITKPALAEADPAVVALSHAVVNRVIAAGYTEYRALLRVDGQRPSNGVDQTEEPPSSFED